MDADPTATVTPDDEHAPPPLPPFSILAILALVLSFFLGFGALVGFWQFTLIPILLGVIAVLGIRRTGKRGHLLAMFGIIIATGFGAFGWHMHSKGAEAFLSVPRGVLGVLTDSSKDAAAKDVALKDWVYKEVLEADAGVPTALREGFEQLVETYGAPTGEVTAGDHSPGFMALVVPPKHGDEINPTTDDTPPPPGKGIWTKLPLEKATIWLCVVLGAPEDDGRGAAGRIAEEGPSPVVGGLRYFLLE